MRILKLVVVVTFQLAISFCASISASTEPLATTSAVPFQLISPAEYNAILELNNGDPFVSQNRLISSGSEVITGIISNIINGLITPVNITGLDPINNSLLKPSVDKTQGYPFCTIQTNRITQHSQRSYDAIVDPPGSNFGTFSINFYHPGTVNIDNYDESLSTDELEEPLDYQHQNSPSTTSRPLAVIASSADSNKDKPNSSVAPVINCIVVLKEPVPPTTTPSPTTTTPTPTPTQRPPKRPSYYPHQYPTVLTPPPSNHPRDPHYSIGPYQIIPIPYPPFLGLLGPASAATPNWANWPSSQASFPSSNPSSAITPTWPYWTMNSPPVASHQGNKNPQTTAAWPYLTIPSHQAASTHVPATSPYLPSTFWTTINHQDAGNSVPLPSSIPNPAAWFRPSPSPEGAFKPNQLMQQQQQQLQYNDNANEIRSVLHDDEIALEDKENQGDALIEEGVKNSQKIQSRRLGGKLI